MSMEKLNRDACQLIKQIHVCTCDKPAKKVIRGAIGGNTYNAFSSRKKSLRKIRVVVLKLCYIFLISAS